MRGHFGHNCRVLGCDSLPNLASLHQCCPPPSSRRGPNGSANCPPPSSILGESVPTSPCAPHPQCATHFSNNHLSCRGGAWLVLVLLFEDSGLVVNSCTVVQIGPTGMCIPLHDVVSHSANPQYVSDPLPRLCGIIVALVAYHMVAHERILLHGADTGRVQEGIFWGTFHTLGGMLPLLCCKDG